MKILLLDPVKNESKKFINRGLLSIATYAKSKGIDLDYRIGSANFEKYDFIGISMLFLPKSKKYKKIVKEIRKTSNAKIISGGYVPKYMKTDSDLKIIGEGEWNFLNSIFNKPFAKLGNLKELPPLDYSILNSLEDNINLEFTRGCSYNCGFCSINDFWENKIRKHNPDKIIEELKQLSILNYKGNISIEDSTLNLKSNSFKDFLKQADKIKRNYNFDYITTHYKHIDEKSLKLAKNLGFDNIILGLETASYELQKNISKIINLEEFRETCKTIKKTNINTNLFLIIGLPGETWETHNKTYTYVKSLIEEELVSGLILNYFKPYLGTKAGNLFHQKYDYSQFNRKTPIIEYPHLTKKDLASMYNSFRNLIKSDFIDNF